MENVIVGCIISIIVWALILGMALWQMKTGSVRLLHSYHTVNVPEEARPALALESGRWLAATGILVMLLGPALMLPAPLADISGFVLVAAMLVAIVLACRAIVKYNGSLFGR
jgi:sterol desaturase/sphingolipid hydroxylase (fatty acid hydroxylase superfamily)